MFEVYRNVRRLFFTKHAEKIPPDTQLRDLKRAGCKIVKDGKAYKIGGGKKCDG